MFEFFSKTLLFIPCECQAGRGSDIPEEGSLIIIGCFCLGAILHKTVPQKSQ
jgi:hypothetical protein